MLCLACVCHIHMYELDRKHWQCCGQRAECYLTDDVEIILGVLWVLLQEASDKPVRVKGCMSVISEIV